jgi:hypothetical protein
MTFLTRSLRFTAAWTLGAALVILVTTVSTGHTAGARTLDYVTVHQQVAVPDTVLPPGEYVFEAVRPDVVRVWRRATREVLYTGFTHQVSRQGDSRRDLRITLGEAPAGEPAPIARWFPTGRARGHQFIYR